VFAECQQQDLARLQDGANTHGQGTLRHVLFTEEVAGGILASHLVEIDQARSAGGRRAGLIEADVAGPADAEDL